MRFAAYCADLSDALALNLGSEPWQADQATSAYTVLSRSRHVHTLKLFISLDMNALPSASAADAAHLARLLARWLAFDAQLVWRRAAVLGTFGGHDASFGGKGWPGVLDPVRKLGNVRVRAHDSRRDLTLERTLSSSRHSSSRQNATLRSST